jgi:hypothetical protein
VVIQCLPKVSWEAPMLRMKSTVPFGWVLTAASSGGVVVGAVDAEHTADMADGVDRRVGLRRAQLHRSRTHGRC